MKAPYPITKNNTAHLAFRDPALNAQYTTLLKVYNIKKAEANTKIARAYHRKPVQVVKHVEQPKPFEPSFITRLLEQSSLLIKRLKIG